MIKIFLLLSLTSFSANSSSVTFYYEIKSPKYDKCIKINNTNLDLLNCDGKDTWEIWYDSTSGQASIGSGGKNWFVMKYDKDQGLWEKLKNLFKTQKAFIKDWPTVSIHEHDPADFIFSKNLEDMSQNVVIRNDAEDKCLDVEKLKKRYAIILKDCTNSDSQKWNITKLRELPYE